MGDAMRAKLENSIGQCKKGPRLGTTSVGSSVSPEHRIPRPAASSVDGEEDDRDFRQQLERLERRQQERLASLTDRWEARFAALEQTVNTGLETATAATKTMNDRMPKFMSLAKMLEDAVDRALKSSKEASTAVRRLAVVEADVGSLAKDLANDKAERTKALERVVKQAEVQMTGMCEGLQSDILRSIRNGGADSSVASNGGVKAQAGMDDLGNIARDLSD